jgi:hypothetical protein
MEYHYHYHLINRAPIYILLGQGSGNRLTYHEWFRLSFLSPISYTFYTLALGCSLHVVLEDPLLWIILWFFLTPFYWTLGVLLPGDVGDIDDAGHAAFTAFVTEIFIILCIGHLRLVKRIVTDTVRTMHIIVIVYVICVFVNVLGHLFSF